MWFYNAGGWDQVYLYIATAGGEEFYGGKPGTAMYRQGGSDWYYMNVPASLGFTVSFSDGSGHETASYTVADKNSVYFTPNGQYASKYEVDGVDITEWTPETSEPVQTSGSANLPGLIAAGGGSAVGVTAVYAVALSAWLKKKSKVKAA